MSFAPFSSAHALDFTEVRSGNHDIAHFERALLDQHGHNRAAPFFLPGLDNGSLRFAVRVGFGFDNGFGHEQNRVQKIRDAFAVFRRNVHRLHIAAERFRHDVIARQVGQNVVGIGVRQVHLVDRDNNRHARLFGELDRLFGLRHDGVVGGNHDNTISVTDAPRARIAPNAA